MNIHNPKNYAKRTKMISQRTASLAKNYGVVLLMNPNTPNRGATLADIRSAERKLGIQWCGNVNHGDARHEPITAKTKVNL